MRSGIYRILSYFSIPSSRKRKRENRPCHQRRARRNVGTLWRIRSSWVASSPPGKPVDRNVHGTDATWRNVSCRVHNTYLFASAWRLVGLILTENVEVGQDKQIRERLKTESDFRSQYLVLYDLINILVDICQQKFAQLATTARTISMSHVSMLTCLRFDP